jgi:pimeloyl-ACP methyl ester carboxylesterase
MIILRWYAAILLCCCVAHSQPLLTGNWSGELRVSTIRLDIRVRFADSSGILKGWIDIPKQSAMGLRLQEVGSKGTAVHFELPTGMNTAKFEGTASADSLSGVFLQGSALGTWVLRPVRPDSSARAVLPYKEEEVTFRNGDITIAGTLSLPPGPGPHPAMVMITGSGAQNRDEELFGFKMFGVIADSCVRKGIAVLRCDDRGIGGSGGNTMTATTADVAADALAGVSYLRSRKEIDGARIGLFGHSEGGIAAPMVASHRENRIAFIILMAGPAERGDSTIIAQVARINSASGMPDSISARAVATERDVLAKVESGATRDEMEKMLLKVATEEYASLTSMQKAAVGDSSAFLTAKARTSAAAVTSVWYRYFLALDPAVFLRKVTCPVLAMYGTLDTQVPADRNAPLMEKLLKQSGNRSSEVRILTRANHLFQKATTGSVAEYAQLPPSFVDEFLPTITSWLSTTVLNK